MITCNALCSICLCCKYLWIRELLIQWVVLYKHAFVTLPLILLYFTTLLTYYNLIPYLTERNINNLFSIPRSRKESHQGSQERRKENIRNHNPTLDIEARTPDHDQGEGAKVQDPEGTC